jgi:hypothetical protein
VQISQITKTDKSTQRVITKYPVFVVTFQLGTDMREVLLIKKSVSLHHTMGEVQQHQACMSMLNCQSFSHSLNFCGKPQKCIKCDQPHAMQECKKPIVLVGDMNCKHTAWNFSSVDRNGRMLLSYCLSQNTAINYPDQPTYSHTNFQPSVLDIALSTAYCPNHCLSPHSPVTMNQWYLGFYYIPPFPNLISFSIICKLTGQFSIPH